MTCTLSAFVLPKDYDHLSLSFEKYAFIKLKTVLNSFLSSFLALENFLISSLDNLMINRLWFLGIECKVRMTYLEK